ncbi:hypothetical protein ACFSC3_14940 [Sphingomonas floccifaciens]|uniref:Tetratricopeptide repeat protein n=1 Tax=Sphingomonas floccifaciens TaxID=1844115 RepID=A0ABW4NH44_9SPHN
MKSISKLALAAALSTGVVSTAIALPAAAQKKNDKAAQGPKLSDAIRKPLAAAQTALTAKDYPTALAQTAIAEPLATTDEEKYFVAAMQLQATAPSNDLQALAPILDKLIVNPKTPPAQLGQYNFLRGEAAFQKKKYAEALPYLTKAQQLGYQNEALQLRIASANIETGNTAGGLAAIDKTINDEIAAGKKPSEDLYNYALGKVYGKDPAATSQWSMRKLKAYPTAKNWRESLLIYRDGAAKGKLDRGMQIDLFRLMRATKSLADRGDYLEYADLLYIGGYPAEAKAVIDEGKATGKIPASDASATRTMTDVNTALKSEGSLAGSETKAKAAGNGKMALSTGDAYLGQGNTAKALEMYALAGQKGGVDASELALHTGAAYAQAGQKDQARTAFQSVSTGPRKDIAAFWLQYLDTGVAGATPAAAAQ